MRLSIITLYSFIIFCLSLYACSSADDIDPSTNLKVNITDFQGKKVENAHINIYKSMDDWYTQTTSYGLAITDTSGSHTFYDLDSNTTYYVDVQLSNTESNWLDTLPEQISKLTLSLETVELNVTVQENNYFYLSNANGKPWVIKSIEAPLVGNVFGQVFEPCDQDNEYIFFKDHSLKLDKGDILCDINDTQTETGSWSIDESGTFTVYADAVGGSLSFTIETISPTSMLAQMSFEGFLLPLTVTFELAQ